MDWIERLTGLEPDGGNGSLEAVLVVVVVLAVIVVVAARRGQRGRLPR